MICPPVSTRSPAQAGREAHGEGAGRGEDLVGAGGGDGDGEPRAPAMNWLPLASNRPQCCMAPQSDVAGPQVSWALLPPTPERMLSMAIGARL